MLRISMFKKLPLATLGLLVLGLVFGFGFTRKLQGLEPRNLKVEDFLLTHKGGGVIERRLITNSFSSALGALVLASAPAFNQGLITIESINVKPSPVFRVDQKVMLSITVKNLSVSTPTERFGTYVDAYRGDTNGRLTKTQDYYLGGLSLDSDQPPLTPGEVREIQFPKPLTFADSPGKVMYLLVGVSAPQGRESFDKETIVAFDRVCPPSRGLAVCGYKRRTSVMKVPKRPFPRP